MVVAVVELSLIVRVEAVDPVVRTAVAMVLEDIDGVEMLAPDPPVTLNRVEAVSDDHRVLVPVRVMDGVVLIVPDVGDVDKVAVAMVMVPVLVSDPVIVRVPVPTPVVITKVAAVALDTDCETFTAPVTPDTVNVGVPGVPLVHKHRGQVRARDIEPE